MTVKELHAALEALMANHPKTKNFQVAIRPRDEWELIGKAGLVKGGIVVEASDTTMLALLTPMKLDKVGGF